MEKQYPYGAGPVKWVSTDWLESQLHSSDLMIVDVQPDVHDYIKRHIPRAVFMHEGLLRCYRNDTPAHYVPEESIQAVFRRTGLRKDVPTVVYTGTGGFKGWGDGLEQTMAAYTLARFGMEEVYILDGGIDKWMTEDRPVTKEYPLIEGSDFSPHIRQDYLVEYEEFKDIKDRDDVTLLDVRPANYYEGQGPWAKPGHIPGAINFPWKDTMDKRNKRLLKPHEEIMQLVEEHNLNRDNTIIVSCGTGREASNMFCLLKFYLDFPKVMLYEGSFTEWVAYDNPTVTGSAPREAEMAVKS